MRSLEGLKEIIKQHRQELEQKYKVKTIAIFGSYARGEETAESDVDILVEFTEPVGLLFVDLADYLEEVLGLRWIWCLVMRLSLTGGSILRRICCMSKREGIAL